MTEETPHPLADRALQRLRKLAPGNGLEPASIIVFDTQESDFILEGTMEVSPLCETQPAAYPGGSRGRDRKMLGSFAELQAAVAKHQQSFREKPDWVAPVVEQLMAHESHGWGLENAKVTLPERSVIFAATETCPSCQGRQSLMCEQCQGRGTVTCTQCQGQGKETCYYCLGRGEDPQQPGQRCPTCHGTRFATCRFCQGQCYLPCPTCQGQRGTKCPTCKGSGRLTEEVTITCGAETHFKLTSYNLPSGINRGLDRIGITNLGKGHADIQALPPAYTKDNPPPEKPPYPVLNYKVRLPYAEMRISFGGGKKGIVSVFGKRCAILGVPTFLDVTLNPWREKLAAAAQGKARIDDALEARALREILQLVVSGKGRAEQVRRLYPFGFSDSAVREILNHMRLALNKATLKARTAGALMCGAVACALFYALFESGGLARLTFGWRPAAGLAMTALLLGLTLLGSWASLNFATRFVLKRRFPQMTVSVRQKTGKTGLAMMAGVTLLFLLMLWFSDAKPLWFYLLFNS